MQLNRNLTIVSYCIKLSTVILLVLCLACNGTKNVPTQQATTSTKLTTEISNIPGQFLDVTQTSGINFKHNSGAFGKKYLPETMGSGCAFIDYDNDGWQDILLVNSTYWIEDKNKKNPSTLALYHNNQNGTFSDVTKAAKLDLDFYGLGVAVGDYDNDGNNDIFISCLGADHLFHNLGNATFEDVAQKAGVSNPDFSTSAAWFDYDKDGWLDLYVCNYIDWKVENDLFCTLDGKNKSYCKPDSYKGQSGRLYHNLGNGKFEDVTEKAKLFDPTSKALGVCVLDYDKDGWLDLFTSNDTEPNKLYHNNQNGTFSEQGVASGLAFNENGVARAGMGTDWSDYDSSGYPSILIGNFANEMLGLYHNEGTGLFIDEAPSSNIGQSTLLSLTFGCFFFDYNLDGLEDIFMANGHVADDINNLQPKITYAQVPKLFQSIGKKKFEEVSTKLGKDFQLPIVARGAAYGDFDNDGDLDLLITTNNGMAHLLKNEGGNKNNFVRITAVGTKTNRSAIGTIFVATFSNGVKQTRMVKSGSSYCSQSELPITFGLGKEASIAHLEIYWPDGTVEKMENIEANKALIIKEGVGIVK